MSYSVKEMYYTLQGEGAHTGRAAVFLRFSGCNLWTGRESDRAKAICQFCDTDFVGVDGPGGGKFAEEQTLAEAVAQCWAEGGAGGAESGAQKYVVCTGGEPLLQLGVGLIEALHARGFEVGVETNGTQDAPAGLDWICVSPKAGAPLKLTQGSELKLVFPQPNAMPERFDGLAFKHFFLQPMDGPQREANTQAAIQYCLKNPRWRLSLQTHKLLNIP